MTGALLGLLFSGGVIVLADGWRRTRRPPVAARVLPYVRDLPAASGTPSWTDTAAAQLRRRVLAWSGRLGEVLSSSASVRRRLIRCGEPPDVEDFRITQALWGLAGFGVGFAVCLLAALRSAPLVVSLMLCALGAILGFMAFDHRLTSRARDRERRMVREFPAVSDLLALAVAAGESPVAATDRVARTAQGPLADELLRVLADIRSGVPVPTAFQELGARTGVASIARFAEAMAVAIDRGTPLVDVLHAQAEDVRDAGRRELVEAAGRREILMMVPVVFLVLPVTVIFAFYPGWVGLSLASGH